MRIAWIICLVFLQLSFSQTPDFGYNPPGNLHLALTGDPTQMVVSWMTTLPTVESIVTVTGHGTFNGTQSSYLLSAGWVHHVIITGLQSSTRYSYQCGSAKNGMSSTYHFTTAPPVGSRNEINLIVYGDEGIFEYSYFTVAHVTELVTKSRLNIDFIYHLGDYGYGNDRDSMWYEFSWNVFFEQNQLIMTTLPYMTLPGNHEEDCGQSTCSFYANNFTVYNYRFNMPNEQSGSPTNMWYSFNYGNIHFVSISTETDYPNCPFPTDTFGNQLAWLESDLAAASVDSNIDWIIVGGHRPMYSSCNGKSANGIPTEDSYNVQQAFEPLFHQYGVDVYFDGHVHGYERSYPVYQSQVFGTNSFNEYYNPPATVYVVNGNAGNVEGFYTSWVTQPSWSANRFWPNPVHGYGLLTVDGADQLRWTWYKNNNATIDNDYFDWFVITRNTTAVSPASPPAKIPVL